MKRMLLIPLLTTVFLWYVSVPPNDFTAPYSGATVARAGIPLYGDEAAVINQRDYYGMLMTDGDQQRFAYPAYSLFIFEPLSLLPFREASALWQGIQLTLMLLALRQLGMKPTASVLILVALKEPLVNIFVGNTALWVTAWVGFGLASMHQKQDRAAGVFFALAAIQPTIAVPLALLILAPRRKAVLSYITTLAVIVLMSIVLWGFWIPDWLAVVRSYSGYTNFLVWIPALFPPAALVGALALWRGWQTSTSERYGLLLTGVTILLPLTGLYHLSLFALVKLSPRWWLLAGAVIWLLAPLPFDVRRFEPLVLAAVVLVYTLRNERRIYDERPARLPVIP